MVLQRELEHAHRARERAHRDEVTKVMARHQQEERELRAGHERRKQTVRR